MTHNENITAINNLVSENFETNTLIKLTISNKRNKTDDLNNVFVRPVIIKAQAVLSFVYRHETRDVTKNYSLADALDQIGSLLTNQFFNADLFTSLADYTLLSNKRGNSKLLKKPGSTAEIPAFRHDKIKQRLITAENNVYLRDLGVLTADWKVKTDMQDKFKQINHYVEIVDDVLKSADLPDNFIVADMGSGKGYLTFALYDHLKKTLSRPFGMIGIELRPVLVETCNRIAGESGFDTLKFETGSIAEAKLPGVNVLIALHACDTATDEAIFRGIKSGAGVIMVAPCCHKQIRKQINPANSMKEITRFGILEERQAEMLTDTIRALLLEAYGYKTRVFEFIATEHTPKNVMISAVKRSPHQVEPDQAILNRITALKDMFGIQYHYLEKLLELL